MKKADLSINTIIVAVIAILVLVVLILIFTGKIGNFREVTNSCANLKGSCSDQTGCANQGGTNMGKLDCDPQICCKTLI